jgi:hypothetical protein
MLEFHLCGYFRWDWKDRSARPHLAKRNAGAIFREHL